MKSYRLVRTKGNRKHIEEHNMPSSPQYWLKIAKKEEDNGCFVSMYFEYDSNSKKIFLTNYLQNDFKSDSLTRINLIRNKKKISKLNKK